MPASCFEGQFGRTQFTADLCILPFEHRLSFCRSVLVPVFAEVQACVHVHVREVCGGEGNALWECVDDASVQVHVPVMCVCVC